MKKFELSRVLLAATGFVLLVLIYLFQQFNYFRFFLSLIASDPSQFHPYVQFIFNKTLRLVLNDSACLLLVIAFFKQPKYLRLATYVFLVEVFCILPLYFYFKLSLEGDSEISSPLLSQVHRMIVNPTLMILLMLGFVYQNLKMRNE